MRAKQKPLKTLKKKADEVFSQWIRISAIDPTDDLVKCVTCPAKKPWKEMQAGHYETRGTIYLRYDERNVHPQCVGCNVFKKGNYPRYATWMLKTYGPTILDELEEESQTLVYNARTLYEDVISQYKAKIAELQNEA